MQIRRSVRAIAILLLAFHVGLILPTLAVAQDTPGLIKQPPPAIQRVGQANQYYLGQANELLIRVNIWGRVRSPGQYFVPATTDLITLISVAGGPEDKSRISDVRLVRSGSDGKNEVIIVNVKKYLKTGDKRLIPDLQPEDTILISGSVWQLLADITQVVGQLALAANVYYLFFIAKR